MKTVIKPVYYCDHCKKRGLSKGHMRNHEARCTANPDRYCGLCKTKQPLREIVDKLKARFILTEGVDAMGFPEFGVYWKNEPVTLQEIRDLVDNCPNCILAVLRQTHLNYQCCGLETFDYKAEFADVDYKPSDEEMRNYYSM